MGQHIHYVFDDGTESLVVLYHHNGGYSWEQNVADALWHARDRQGNPSYWTRMVISHLMYDSILDSGEFGLLAIKREELEEITSVTDVVVLDTKNGAVLSVYEIGE